MWTLPASGTLKFAEQHIRASSGYTVPWLQKKQRYVCLLDVPGCTTPKPRHPYFSFHRPTKGFGGDIDRGKKCIWKFNSGDKTFYRGFILCWDLLLRNNKNIQKPT